MWDNRGSKKNPKAPDYRCKDKENCDGVRWEKKNSAATNGAKVAAAAPWTWGALSRTYGNCLALAAKHVPATGKESGLPVTMSDILAGAHTLFIEVGRRGVVTVPAKKAPPPPPPPQEPEAEEEEDDSLPF